MKRKLFTLLIAVVYAINIQGQNRWNMQSDGSISWTVKTGEAHSDNIEMSGRFISMITTYGVDDKGRLITEKTACFSHAEDNSKRYSCKSDIYIWS